MYALDHMVDDFESMIVDCKTCQKNRGDTIYQSRVENLNKKGKREKQALKIV